MNKTLLIFRQEFRSTVRRGGFIVLTLSLPVLALLGIGIFQIFSGPPKPPAPVSIGYVAEAGGFDQFNQQGNITLVPFGSADEAKQALIGKQITDYFVIPADYVASGAIQLYTTKQELSAEPATLAAIGNFIVNNLLAGKVPADVVARVQIPPNVAVTTLTDTGSVAPQQGGYTNFIVPAIFSLFLALSLIFSSTYVLQSLSEEKENRLMEILLSSVSTRQLLAGKVLGLGATGLVQVLVWVISTPLLLGLASSSIGGVLAGIHVPASLWLLGVVYFILGYGVFAVLSASVASITSSLQEARNLSTLYSLFAVAPYWLLSLLLLYPNNPAWVALTIFPLSAPVMVMMRLGLLGVPAWQLTLSILLLALSVYGGLVLASRLLRAYMLLYGKRPGLGQIIRSLRNAG